jgi:hypothetical protein
MSFPFNEEYIVDIGPEASKGVHKRRFARVHPGSSHQPIVRGHEIYSDTRAPSSNVRAARPRREWGLTERDCRRA